MSTSVQRRRGTTAQHASFAGLNGEITVDTDKKTVVVHDGTTAGGAPLLRENGSQNAVTTGTSTAASFIPTSSTAPTNGVYLAAPSSVAISTNGAQKLTINSAGRVTLADSEGIQLAAKASSLYTVDGSLSCYGTNNGVYLNGAGASGWLQLQAAGTENNRTAINLFGSTSGSPDIITFRTANNERLRITSGGLVGIGTSAPPSLCSIAGPAVTGTVGRLLQVYSSSATGVGSGSEIWLGWNPSNLNAGGGVTIGGIYNGTGADLVFSTPTNSSSAPAERVRIDSSGRLGIGTTSPQQALQVIGGARFGETGNNYYEVTISNGITYLNARSSSGSSGTHAFYTDSTERARIDSSGRLLVGTSSAITTYQTPGLQVHSTSDNFAGASFTCYQNTIYSGNINFGKSRGTSVGSFTAVQSGDQIGGMFFNGADGTQFVPGAEIRAYVDGTPGANDMPGRLVFSTTKDNSSNPTLRLNISNEGAHGIVCESATDCLYVSNAAAAGTTRSLIRGRHSATVGTAYSGTESFLVYTNGNVQNTNNSYAGISDIKLKENIVDASSQWDDIKRLQVRKYNFKEQTGQQTHTQIGLVAQEVELVSPGLVSESPDRDVEGNDLGTVTKSVNYSVLYMKAVKALQEAMKRIETLEAKVAALEAA